MNETTVQGHTITRKAVEAFLRGTEPVPPLRNASFYVVRNDDTKVGAKEVIYALTNSAKHWGDDAAKALLRLGFVVHVRRRARTHSLSPYAAFADSGLLIFDDDEVDIEKLKGTRKRVLGATYPRAGQPKFRRALFAAYDGQCAISGTRVEFVLEAAHIIPYASADSNVVRNGLLLRADLHLLFDAWLLGIDSATLSVELDASLRGTSYWDLNGKRLRLPKDPKQHPSRKALASRQKTVGLTTTGTNP
jgi:putative restriction endonuclease